VRSSPRRPLGLVSWIADLDVLGGPEEIASRLQSLLAAGLSSVQLRGKSRATAELVEAGRALRERTVSRGALFVVNGDLEAAALLEADGVHLPAAGPTVREARAVLPAGTRVGVSAHDPAEIARASGADWVLLSPVFPTRSKPGAPALGLSRFRELVGGTRAAVYALGGITAGNVEECLSAGAAGVAAIRGLAEPDGETLLREARAWATRAE
jgi:thiamine-phosphate diphosphorylase